jgi:hypothetical protein
MTNNNIEIAQRCRQCLAQNGTHRAIDDSRVFYLFFVFLLSKGIQGYTLLFSE